VTIATTSRPPITRRPRGRRPPAEPDPGRLAALLVRVWLEVREGQRPMAQLAPLLAPAAHRRLAAQLPAKRSRHPSPATTRVRTVTLGRPSPRACEGVVLVERCGRTTAFAVRLERHRGAWRVVELTAPETGLRPLPTASLTEDAPLRDAFDEVLDDPSEPPRRS
jgi:hypothetical protein